MVMRYTVTISPGVIDKLDQQEQYLAVKASPQVAERYIDGLLAFLDGLDTFPERGHPRDDLVSGLRISGYKKSASIAIVVQKPYVLVVGVFFGGENYESELRQLNLQTIDPQELIEQH
ncbi:MAG TPA: type II toxin-antitoxin system RelE/ParE family toxin [Dyella sp.]|uniref:type II toxin-antitoxin system RelE/ParE family toxin n=1 Tax=Dyella sp. TaxID=1869338 RepID=UPI002F95A05F